ncbi:hypothetical protein GPECTOR_576g626 [Gonium pectorale]|uniref:PRC-barrel domain-containing protein n=1 Tax=Gonium pectorale TaxID=33097 RepID=A0A150FUN4_GONPE|nr:hypothetical protein GPECTOR_576g626 [Gonium pectorale]|eukprot:KXZ41288.1 hypothetical protein GPECTOR_576g626 [Gonium pectorale]
MALVRRPLYQPVQSQQSIYLNLSQVADKQVITCNKGRNLGTIGEAWVDPQRLEVVSFELEAKRGVSSSVTGTIPLMMLKQVGDVVLVQDTESMPLPTDGRAGFVKLLGMEVRTRNNRVVGKVRDFAFNPNNGAITKVEFDDFGLTFLPVNFFDTTSIASDFIESVAYGAVVVSTDEYARPEKPGILSGLLRGLGRTQVAGLLSDGSRASEAAGLLPAGYTYEKWQSDIARWEMETGLRAF